MVSYISYVRGLPAFLDIILFSAGTTEYNVAHTLQLHLDPLNKHATNRIFHLSSLSPLDHFLFLRSVRILRHILIVEVTWRT